MLFYILLTICVSMFLYGLIKRCNTDTECGMVIAGTIGSIIFLLVIGLTNLSYSYDFAKINMLPVIIKNKVDNIERMKTTYIETTKKVVSSQNNVNIYQNIDVVNRDLAKRIAEEMTQLEKFINKWNFTIADLKNNYRLRFWTHCNKPPSIDQLILTDYLN